LPRVKSNYYTDLFAPLLAAISRTTGKPYEKTRRDDVSLRVIADMPARSLSDR
jgi:alanyl-tRNA synthetase